MVNYIMVGFVLAAILLYVGAYSSNPKAVRTAVDNTLHELFHPSSGFAYLIFSAFLISSMLLLILPKEIIAQWIGQGSGLRGVAIGTVVGAVTPGGPFLTFPILVGLYRAGAGIGPIIAYITSWSLLGLNRIIVWEIPFLGPKIVLVRVLVSLAVPLILGLIGNLLYDALGY